MLNGKSIFSWNVPATEGGDPDKFVKYLLDNNFEGVCLKAGDGASVQKVSRWSPWPTWGENIRLDLVDTIKGAGLKVFLWHMLYGIDPPGELNIALSQVSRFQPDGYIWDVEGAFDSKVNAVGNAGYISRGLRKFFPNLDQGLCWWALPLSPSGTEWHPLKVAEAFMPHVDVAMPMMYWQGKGPDAAVKYLYRSLDIYKKFWTKPVLPIGRAYNGDGGYADALGISAFADEVISLRSGWTGIPGISWWSLDKASKNEEWTLALRETEKFDIMDPVKLTEEEILARLVENHKDLFPELDFS